jgi:hypothetical protein
MRIYPNTTRPLILAATAALLQACSGGEDPRISMCRGIAADFAGGEVSQWSSAGNRFVRPEFAEVKVKAGDQSAACYYEYDVVEETALDHAEPLLAYSTLPYRMTFNGVEVARPTLKAAVIVQQKEAPAEALRQAERAVEQARVHMQQARQQVQQAVEAARNR